MKRQTIAQLNVQIENLNHAVRTHSDNSNFWCKLATDREIELDRIKRQAERDRQNGVKVMFCIIVVFVTISAFALIFR